jgi:hypothetical protein
MICGTRRRKKLSAAEDKSEEEMQDYMKDL